MAEGGEWRPDDEEWKNKFWTEALGNDDKEEGNVPQSFKPGEASTLYHGREQQEMQSMMCEHSGLSDTSYAEDPLLGELLQPEENQSKVDMAIDFIRKRFPEVDLKKLGPIGFSKKGQKAELVSFGPKGGETQIFTKDGSGFLKSFTDRISKSLGPSAEQIILEDRDTIQEQRQRLEKLKKNNKRQKQLLQKERKNCERWKI